MNERTRGNDIFDLGEYQMNETEVKYLAGLLDADGSCFFTFNHDCLGMTISLSASKYVDKNNYLSTIPFGQVQEVVVHNQRRWNLSREKDINMLLPRLLKHMVIKAKQWEAMYSLWKEYKGKKVDKEYFKSFQKENRVNCGPLKEKKHPTWAWIAGYLDGDGCYALQHRKDGYTRMFIDVSCKDVERQGIDLLYKAFGGTIRPFRVHLVNYRKNLGKRDKAFAIRFLKKMVVHSKLKKHKIEQLLCQAAETK